MKTILNLVAICMTVAIIGCSATHNTVSPGAVSECGAKDGMACTKDKSECCGAAKCDGDKAAMGAVSECAEKAECSKTCPATGASMGAVSECGVEKECTKAKAECTSLGAVSECGAKKECSTKASCTSMGAMSEKTCATKSACSAKKSCGN